MRRSTRQALSAALLCGALVVPAAGAGAATGDDLVGTYRLVSIDNLPGAAHHGHYRHLLVSGQRTYVLKMAPGTRPEPGARLRVRGRRHGGELRVSRMQSLDGTAIAYEGEASAQGEQQVAFSNGSTGTTNVLVILARWNAAASTVTQASAAQVLLDNNAWFAEASYGQLGVTGAVTPWLTIPAPSGVACGSGMTSIETSAKSAAQSAGFDPSGYDRTMIFFPKVTDPECSGVGGWAYIGGNTSWINGVLDRRITVHEQGHNYGLLHAHSYTCTSGGVHVALAATGCTSLDYGNPFDAMGNSAYAGSFSAPYKNELGWLAGRQVALLPGESVRLAPFQSVDGPVAASITDGDRTFWVEYRRKAGIDSRLPISTTTGAALVHAIDPAIVDGSGVPVAGAGLLDMSPDGSHIAAELPSGTSWLAPGGFLISVSAADSTGVTVTRSGLLGERAAATLAITSSASTVTYPAAVTLRGRLMSGTTPLAGSGVSLYARKRGTTTWRYVRTVLTAADGYAATTSAPSSHTEYQWRFAGDAGFTGATSATKTVYSRIRLTAKLSRTSMPRYYTATLYGSIGPAHSGQYVYLQRYYSGAWRTVGTIRLGTSTKFAAKLKIGVRGKYYFRYYVKSHGDHYGAKTSTVTLKVY